MLNIILMYKCIIFIVFIISNINIYLTIKKNSYFNKFLLLIFKIVYIEEIIEYILLIVNLLSYKLTL